MSVGAEILDVVRVTDYFKRFSFCTQTLMARILSLAKEPKATPVTLNIEQVLHIEYTEILEYLKLVSAETQCE